MEALRTTLETVARRLGGVRALAVGSQDGFLVGGWSGDPGLDLNALVAEHAPLYQEGCRLLETEERPEILLMGRQQTRLLAPLGEGHFVLVLLGPEALPGKVRYRLQQEVEGLRELLA